MYYYSSFRPEENGNVITVIGKNREAVEKHSESKVESLDIDWVNINSDYEPVQIVGIEGDTERDFYFYITKEKEVNTFVSTNKSKLEIEFIENTIQDVETVSGQLIKIETEYEPVVR